MSDENEISREVMVAQIMGRVDQLQVHVDARVSELSRQHGDLREDIGEIRDNVTKLSGEVSQLRGEAIGERRAAAERRKGSVEIARDRASTMGGGERLGIGFALLVAAVTILGGLSSAYRTTVEVVKAVAQALSNQH